uniref:Uncharacterized protein n=1 Tax=Latimeria chalumnae TaxID=7897 RepID=H2ZSU2_LATCH
QAVIVARYRDNFFFQLVTCYDCDKTSRHYGVNRAILTAMANSSSTPKAKTGTKTPDKKKTPQSASKRNTPVSQSRAGSKGKSPAAGLGISTSGQSTSSPSPKISSGKKGHFSRLRMLLNLEEKQLSKKSSLRDFLSSL